MMGRDIFVPYPKIIALKYIYLCVVIISLNIDTPLEVKINSKNFRKTQMNCIYSSAM